MSWILLNIHMLDWLLLGCDVYSKDFEKEVIELLQDVGIGWQSNEQDPLLVLAPEKVVWIGFKSRCWRQLKHGDVDKNVIINKFAPDSCCPASEVISRALRWSLNFWVFTCSDGSRSLLRHWLCVAWWYKEDRTPKGRRRRKKKDFHRQAPGSTVWHWHISCLLWFSSSLITKVQLAGHTAFPPAQPVHMCQRFRGWLVRRAPSSCTPVGGPETNLLPLGLKPSRLCSSEDLQEQDLSVPWWSQDLHSPNRLLLQNCSSVCH